MLALCIALFAVATSMSTLAASAEPGIENVTTTPRVIGNVVLRHVIG